jgi:hypothetical protein
VASIFSKFIYFLYRNAPKKVVVVIIAISLTAFSRDIEKDCK